jgi:Fe-S cluster assembly ATP-binding protein
MHLELFPMVKQTKSDKNAIIVITHYQRLLDHIVPDFVHVLYDGKIVKQAVRIGT